VVTQQWGVKVCWGRKKNQRQNRGKRGGCEEYLKFYQTGRAKVRIGKNCRTTQKAFALARNQTDAKMDRRKLSN